MTIPEDRLLRITPFLVIPMEELDFRTSRSGGPGGQHVNKTETKVELVFDVANSPSLTEGQRARLLEELTSWLDSTGVLHLVSSQSRSQYRNREDTITRFVALLQQSLRPQKIRKETRVSRGAKEARLESKKHRGQVKRQRGSQRSHDD